MTDYIQTIGDLESISSLAERYEEYEEEELLGHQRGGKGPAKKKRDPNSLTSRSARKTDIQRAESVRRENSLQRIRTVVEGFPSFKNAYEEDSFISQYVEWVRKSIMEGLVLNIDNDLSFEYVLSGKKAGGQNVNKVNSAVRCVHRITGLAVRNQETPDQNRNKANATYHIQTKLEEHIKDWRTFLGAAELTPDLVLKIMADEEIK